MIRKNLLKATLITTVVATLLTATACGKKSVSNIDNAATQEVTTVSTEAKTDTKETAKTGLVTFDYTDEAGTTYTLEGKAVTDTDGNAAIEVMDADGNKVTFTGKAKTVDGKLSVSDIAVKDAGTLVKADGTEIKVSTESTVADASESTEGESNSDIAASDDVKEEVETAKKEEEQVAEESKEDKEETVVADNSSSDDTDREEDEQPVSEEKTEAATQPENSPEPKEEEKEEPKTEAPAKQPEVSTEAPTEKQTEAPTESKYVDGPNGPMYAFDGSNYNVAGQDVNQGANVACPYALKTVTTRYFFDGNSYSNKQGYYYIGVDEYGSEVPLGHIGEEYHYQLEHLDCTGSRVGTFSCGEVWFCAFND